jgi:hypothetical protein
MEKVMLRKPFWIALAGALAVPAVALADDGVTAGQFFANNAWMML